jgi:hypothetical protein
LDVDGAPPLAGPLGADARLLLLLLLLFAESTCPPPHPTVVACQRCAPSPAAPAAESALELVADLAVGLLPSPSESDAANGSKAGARADVGVGVLPKSAQPPEAAGGRGGEGEGLAGAGVEAGGA